MSQAFHDIPQFEELNLFKYAIKSFKTGKQMLYNIIFDGAYFLLAVMVGGDEHSQLRMAN